MTFQDLKKVEDSLALAEWCDCDRRRKELARPILVSEIEMKLSFIEWLDEPVFGEDGWFKKFIKYVAK